MSTNGIQIEQLKIGWMQLLVGAFIVGSLYSSIIYSYGELVEVKTKQEANIEKYIPIIERLDTGYVTQSAQSAQLNQTLNLLNTNLTRVLALREREDQDRVKTEKAIEDLKKELSDLRLTVGQVRSKYQKLM